MTRIDSCPERKRAEPVSNGPCPRCRTVRPHVEEIAAGVPPLVPAVKVAEAEAWPAPATDPAADLHPQCSLGEVSHGPRWTIRAPEAAGLPFRLEGDGIAIALDVAHAAELHVQLGAALAANLALRIAQVRA